jgi:hypothetical protein
LVLENPSQEEPFLVQDPLDIIHSEICEYVSLMIGCTTGKAVPFLVYSDGKTGDSYEKIISWNFGYPKGSEESKSATKARKKFYFGHEKPSEIDLGRKCQVSIRFEFLGTTRGRIFLALCRRYFHLWNLSDYNETISRLRCLYLSVQGLHSNQVKCREGIIKYRRTSCTVKV